MAIKKEEIRQNYPMPVYNYRVDIEGVSVAFSQVSGLSLSYETHVYKESPTGEMRGPVTMRMPAQQSDVKITLKKGLVKGKSIPTLYNWIKSVQTNQIEKKNILVSLLDEAGKPLVNWSIQNAFPTKLEAPSFDAKSNDAAIESMELMADTILIEES